jgi:hypothetical protein
VEPRPAAVPPLDPGSIRRPKSRRQDRRPCEKRPWWAYLGAARGARRGSKRARFNHVATVCGCSRCKDEPSRSFCLSKRSDDHADRACHYKFNPLVLVEIQTGADIGWRGQLLRCENGNRQRCSIPRVARSRRTIERDPIRDRRSKSDCRPVHQKERVAAAGVG